MKKALIIFIILLCFAIPAFSQNQNANAERSKALSDSMAASIDTNTEKLASMDDQISGTGNTKAYSEYRRKYDSIKKAMDDCEYRFNMYVRTNDTNKKIKAERDRYEELLHELESLKSEYDKK